MSNFINDSIAFQSIAGMLLGIFLYLLKYFWNPFGKSRYLKRIYSDSSFAVYSFTLHASVYLGALYLVIANQGFKNRFIESWGAELYPWALLALAICIFVVTLLCTNITLIIIALAHSCDYTNLASHIEGADDKINKIYNKMMKEASPDNEDFLIKVFRNAYMLLHNRSGSNGIPLIASTDSSLCMPSKGDLFTYAFMIAQDRWSTLHEDGVLSILHINDDKRSSVEDIKKEFNEMFLKAFQGAIARAKENHLHVEKAMNDEEGSDGLRHGSDIIPSEQKVFNVVRVLFFDPVHLSHSRKVLEPLIQSTQDSDDKILNFLVPAENKDQINFKGWINEDPCVMQKFHKANPSVVQVLRRCTHAMKVFYSDIADTKYGKDILCIGERLLITTEDNSLHCDLNHDAESNDLKRNYLKSLVIMYILAHSKAIFLFKDIMETIHRSGDDNMSRVIASIKKSIDKSETASKVRSSKTLCSSINKLEKMILNKALPDNWSVGDPDDDVPGMTPVVS